MTDPAAAVSVERLEAWQRLRCPRRATDTARLPERPVSERRRQAQADRLVRGVLRHLALLDALLEHSALFAPHRTPRDVRWILRLAAYEKIFQASVPDYAIGVQAVALARRAGGARAARFVNAVVRRLLPLLPASPEALAADPFVAGLPPDVRWSLPRPILDRLAEGYGAETFAEVLPALADAEAPVWLRVNTLRADPAALRRALAAEGLELTAPAPLPEALLWHGGAPLPWRTAAWRRGDLTIQDLGAMLATVLLDPQPGQAVLDACAAPGGKTGHLWQRMDGRGRLVALEPDPARRDELAAALVRLFGRDHPIELPAGETLESLPGDPVFHRVLLDVPCLALGLVGRHPEIRWDGRLGNAQRLIARQRDLLDAGARRVAPGGRLLWVTCSPTRLENEDVIQPWLQAHPEWTMIDPTLQLGPAWPTLLDLRGGWVRTRPDRIACDGFAMALLECGRAS